MEISEHGDVVVARLRGDIDFSDAGRLSAELLGAVSNDAIGLVIDLSQVRYIDSSGVRVLFELARRLETCRQRLAVSLAETSPVRRLLKISKLDEVVMLCVSVDDCLAQLHEASPDHV